MTLVENKKVRLNFSIGETYSAGIELLGQEVKTLRSKRGSLEGARIVVRGGEAYLVGMTIPPYQPNNTAKGYDPERSRRLLLTKKELHDLASAEDTKGLTIVPIEMYTSSGLVKVRLAISSGKKKQDRREDLKRRDADRERQRAIRGR